MYSPPQKTVTFEWYFYHITLHGKSKGISPVSEKSTDRKRNPAPRFRLEEKKME
jgi:hypothetical protein